MRIKNKHLWGRISPSGELMLNQGTLGDFLRIHSGKNCIVRIDIIYPAVSDKQKKYYWDYVCKEVRNALAKLGETLTIADTDAYLRANYPFCWDEDYTSKPRKRLRTFDELNTAECNDFFEHIYQFAAENLDLTLDDPMR